MNKKRVILISLDALSSTEFSIVKQLPNFSKLINEGSYCRQEFSVYPSLTFPCHASIATGCNPGSHGIISNYLFEPGSEIHHWNFYTSNLKRKAIWDYAVENNKTVLNMSWPVSAGGNIRWSMPEMTPAKPKLWTIGNFFRQLEVFRRFGTPGFAFRSLWEEKQLIKNWFTGKQPNLDKHMISQFQRAIRKYPFDIALFHIYGMDNAKHTHGINSKAVHSYLNLYDTFIGNLIEFVDEQKKHGESVCLMVTGDHSQLPVKKSVFLNVLLNDMNLCHYKNGKLVSWDALFAPCDGSAYLYVKNKNRLNEITDMVRSRLENHPAIAKIFSPKEAATLGADPDCALMVESADGYGTETNWCAAASLDQNFVTDSHCKGLHGYLPSHPDYQTLFFCYGPEVSNGYEIPNMAITDITPSICHYFDMKTDPTDGKPITKMFKNN